MSTLTKAIEIAARAHADQTDKVGAPYILHPLRIMMRVTGEEEQIVAVLHDVVEDSDYTLDDLRAAGFAPEIVEAVDLLTHRDEDSYDAYVERLSTNPLARRVKLGDLEDNMDIKRLEQITPKALARLERYHKAWVFLQQADRGI
ncbi:MAG: HD domain-containing protein [Caldilineaceae bacterium]|nr:HD domain-containing protein [Caldilineaceae bacterium]